MKKNIVLLFLILSLSSCFWDKSETESVDDIKQGLLQQTGTTVEETSTGVIEISTGTTSDENIEDKGYKIEYTTDDKFLELDSLDGKTLEYGDIVITGKTLQKVDKIEVAFSNKDSKFPTDSFVLKKFKAGDETFSYNAFSKYSVLDYGENIYEITAYSGDKVSTLKLTLLIKAKEGETTEKQETSSGTTEETKVSTQNSSTGTTTSSGTTCETLNDYLSENMTTWYYWNTCRPSDNGIGFYLVRLDGKNYVYERYNISNSGEVSIKELEKGSSNEDTKDTIEARNNELKLRNSEFDAKIK